MERSFFVYGSLLFEDVWEDLIGRIPIVYPAVLYGYRRYSVEDTFYPGIWFWDDASVVGGHVFLNEEEEWCIDDYEGDEYIKTIVSISIAEKVVSARTYIRPPTHQGEWIQNWSEEIFHHYRNDFFSF